MINDPYSPSTYDDYSQPSDGYYEYPPAYSISDEWMNAQEYEPIIPLPDTDDMDDDYAFDSQTARQAGSDRTMQPGSDRAMQPGTDEAMQARHGRPYPPRPNRPIHPGPGRPPRPWPDNPGRPPHLRPDRPVYPPIYNPVLPVQPDWSWNWGITIPAAVIPLFSTRVRFYNAAVMGPVRVYVNNRLVAGGLNYLTYSRFYHVSPGRYRITIYRGNSTGAPIVDTWMSFRRNTSYTLTLSGSVSNYWLQSSTF